MTSNLITSATAPLEVEERSNSAIKRLEMNEEIFFKKKLAFQE